MRSSAQPTGFQSVLSTALAAFVLLYSSLGLADEQAADVDRYCRDQFGANAVAGVDRRDNGLLCTTAGNNGLNLTHHKIREELVCAVQHTTNKFRRVNDQLYCVTSTAPTRVARTVDLEKFCRDTHGPDAFVTRRNADNKSMCSIRTDGGLGLRHHVIDVASVCGGRSGQVNGKTLHCRGGAPDEPIADADGGDKLVPADVEAARNREFPPLDPENVIDTEGSGKLTDKNVKFANLKDCGGFLDDFRTMFRDPKGLDGRGHELQGVSKQCPGLVGGRMVEFLTYCASICCTPATRWTMMSTPSGRPVCWRHGRPEIEDISDLALAESTSGNSAICLHAFREELGEHYRKYAILYKYEIREAKIECFYMKRDQLIRLIKGDDPPFEIFYTEAEPPYTRIEELLVGQMYRIVVEFSEIPDQQKAPLSLTNPRTGVTISTDALPSDDKKTFRTSPLKVLEAVKP